MIKKYKTPRGALKAMFRSLEEYCNTRDKEYTEYFLDGLSTENNNGMAKTRITKTNDGWELEII